MKRRPARRPARIDPVAPQNVRSAAGEGPTAVMRAEWRDPDDDRPTAARVARTISGYRTFCPLRRMHRLDGSQITERHILAADRLRAAVDAAAIGLTGLRETLPVTAVTYGPVSGPTLAARKQAQAAADVARVFARLLPSQRPMVVEIVLLNRTVHAWCRTTGARTPSVELGRLLAILDLLESHYAGEIDADLASGHVAA